MPKAKNLRNRFMRKSLERERTINRKFARQVKRVTHQDILFRFPQAGGGVLWADRRLAPAA